ncbi:MAG: hypothetical protein HZC42_05650 [Candidatus Eisenbacteria bacterium]|nr:hypothetical protein [Candidatus Eisenbacteria bacterium]
MPDALHLTETFLIELARTRGLALDPARAAALCPQVESLLGRLARFADLLPADTVPAPPAPVPSGPNSFAPGSSAPNPSAPGSSAPPAPHPAP